MLTRALTLVSRGQHDRAYTLLNETRSILKGLGKGGLPPVPPPSGKLPLTPHQLSGGSSPVSATPDRKRTPSPTSAAGSGLAQSRSTDALSLSSGIDADTVAALDAELESSLWAGRVGGVKRLTERSREWRDEGEGGITEEA